LEDLFSADPGIRPRRSQVFVPAGEVLTGRVFVGCHKRRLWCIPARGAARSRPNPDPVRARLHGHPMTSSHEVTGGFRVRFGPGPDPDQLERGGSMALTEWARSTA